jgi:Uma2 family endonuclease
MNLVLEQNELYEPIRFNRFQMTDDEFFDFCEDNKELKFERNADGTIIVMPLTGGKTRERNTEIVTELVYWRRKNGGKVFDSSTGFKLPNGATRSPDAAWINIDRWNELTESEKEKYPPITPDFVNELASNTDSLKSLKTKIIEEYIGNGVKLAWLIYPKTETTFIYRIDGTSTKIEGFDNVLSGEDVLVGFEFDLKLLRN